jgi:serine/threonine-protein kinase
MYTAFLQKDVPSIRDAVPELPEDVAGLVDRCLHKKREERLDDLGPLADALSRYTNPDTPGARAGGTVVGALTLSGTRAPSTAALARTAPAEAAPAAKRRTTLALAGVGVAVVLGGITVIALRPGGARPPVVTPSAEPAASHAPEPTVAPTVSAAPVLASATALPAAVSANAALPPRAGQQHSGPRATSAASTAAAAAPTSAPRKGIEEKLPY